MTTKHFTLTMDRLPSGIEPVVGAKEISRRKGNLRNQRCNLEKHNIEERGIPVNHPPIDIYSFYSSTKPVRN
jgi:hypothetical protein